MNEHNYSIDLLKLFCAILVVFLHTGWIFEHEFMPFTKCAVPCFFIISGYLLFDDYDIKQERLKRNLKHIGIIALWSTALFAFWKEFICIFIEGHIYIPSANSLLAWVVFNDSPFEYHLWYLFAYLYVLLIVALINKYNKWEILYCVVPILLIADLAFGSYSILLWGWEPPYIYVRNFLFVGLPYFAIGTYIKRCMKEGGAFSPFARYILVGGILLFTVTTYFESFFLQYMGTVAIREHYLSSSLLAICLFLVALSVTDCQKSRYSMLGEKDSLYIYIFHPILIRICSIFFKKTGLYEAYYFVAPLIILITTLILIYSLKRIRLIK